MNKPVTYTYITVLINVLFAMLLFFSMSGGTINPIKEFFDYIIYFYLNFTAALVALFVSSYYAGKKMGKLICEKKWNSILVGMIGLMVILICGVLGGATVGFLEEGIMRGHNVSDSIVDYYFKPLFWILIFGFIPTFISGAFLGKKIKKTCGKTI